MRNKVIPNSSVIECEIQTSENFLLPARRVPLTLGRSGEFPYFRMRPESSKRKLNNSSAALSDQKPAMAKQNCEHLCLLGIGAI